MTDRVSKIILRADIRDLQAKMVVAGKSVSDFGDRITNQDKKSVAFRKGLTSVGDAAGKMGLVAAAGLGAAVVASARFDSAISKVQAATHESAQSMEALRAAAIRAGADTAFSATEAADAITALSKAGVSVKDVLGGGLTGSLSLASAGELDVAQSAEIAATAMTQFGLSGKDIPHIADLLAAGAGKAQGEVTDMAQALKYVGPVAHQMGVSIEETTGTIAELASQGILADQAGTSLRGMLSSLTSPSKIAREQMKALGIELYNAQGNFVGFSGVADQLHKTMSGLSNAERDQALGRIFGNEQITAARILYSGGAQDVDKWTKAVNDNGYAADTASIKMDNLAGDFEKLKGSLSTLLIEGGEGSQGFLRGVTQGADDAVHSLNKLPAPVKDTIQGLVAITAVTGGALWFGATFITKITEARAAIAALGFTSGASAARLAALAKGAGLAAVAFIGIGAAADALQGDGKLNLPGINDLTNQLNDIAANRGAETLTKQLGDIGTAVDVLEHRNGLTKFSVGFNGIFGVKDEGKDAATQRVESLDAALAGLVSSGHADTAAAAIKNLAAAQHLSKADTDDLLHLLPGYRDALAGVAGVADDTSGAVGGMSGATDTNTDSTDKNTKALQDNIKAMQEKADAAVSAFDAETAYQRALVEGADRDKEAAAVRKQIADAQTSGTADRRSLQSQLAGEKDPKRRADLQAQITQSYKDQAAKIAALKKQLDDYAHTLDKSTVAGRANRDILSDMAKGFNGLSDKQKNAKGAYQDARAALIKQAEAFGANSKRAKKYADDLLQIPPRVQTKLDLEKKKAQDALDDFKRDFYGLKPKTVKLFLKSVGSKVDNQLGEKGYADGGFTGAGGKFEPAGIVHRGEFVIDAEQTMRHRALLEAIHRRAPGYSGGGYVREQKAQLRGYAGGGFVTGGGSGLSSGDIDRIVNGLSAVRPLYGDVHMQPHNYDQFKRQMDRDQRNAASGAESFR